MVIEAVPTNPTHFAELLALDQRFRDSDLQEDDFVESTMRELKSRQPVQARAFLKGTRIYDSLLQPTKQLFWSYNTAWDPLAKAARGYCRYLHDPDRSLVYVSWLVAPGIGKLFWKALEQRWKAKTIELFVSLDEREVGGNAAASSERAARRLNFYAALGFRTERIEWPYSLSVRDSTGATVSQEGHSSLLLYMVLVHDAVADNNMEDDPGPGAVAAVEARTPPLIVVHIDGVPGAGKSWLCQQIKASHPDTILCVDTDDMMNEAYWQVRSKMLQAPAHWEDFHDRMNDEMARLERQLVDEATRLGKVLVLAGIQHRMMTIMQMATQRYFVQLATTDLAMLYRRLLRREYNKIIDQKDAIQQTLDAADGDVRFMLDDIEAKINFAGLIPYDMFVQDYEDRKKRAEEQGYTVLPQTEILEHVHNIADQRELLWWLE